MRSWPTSTIQLKKVNSLNISEQELSEATERFSKGLQFETISHDSNNSNVNEFDKFLVFLNQSFPLVHSKLERIQLDCHSLFFKWKGKIDSLKPILLMSHMDVVPVEENSEHWWENPPFGGKIVDGFIWGRGTLDDKSGVFGILEAVEFLLRKGIQPDRTVYLSFGHDEEIGGHGGNQIVAQWMQKNGITLEFVLDEGGCNSQNLFPGIEQPISIIGIAEKGYITVKLAVELEGGHSSMPPLETPIGILSNAIARLEANQMPASITNVFRDMIRHIGPALPLWQQVVLGNLWFFQHIVCKIFEKKSSTNALIRTTMAPTVLRAGTKDNVLARRATALFNFRMLPGDSIQDVVEHIRSVVNDKRVHIERLDEGLGKEASPVSSTKSLGWHILTETIQEQFPDNIIAPYLVVGATDGRYFSNFSDSVYRYHPYTLFPTDLARIHGTNERVRVEDFKQMIEFYIRLILMSQQEGTPIRKHEELQI